MFQDWYSTEWNNTGLDENALAHIEKRLGDHDRNGEVIQRRLESVFHRDPRFASYFDVSTGRLPSVLAVPCDDCAPVPDKAQWMLRRKNCGYLDKPDYRLSYLLPLHSTTSDERFERMFMQLKLKR